MLSHVHTAAPISTTVSTSSTLIGDERSAGYGSLPASSGFISPPVAPAGTPVNAHTRPINADALERSLALADVRRGDPVFVPPNTPAASVRYVGSVVSEDDGAERGREGEGRGEHLQTEALGRKLGKSFLRLYSYP